MSACLAAADHPLRGLLLGDSGRPEHLARRLNRLLDDPGLYRHFDRFDFLALPLHRQPTARTRELLERRRAIEGLTSRELHELNRELLFTVLPMRGSGSFFKKVGNDIAAHELLVAGKTRPTVYTDRRIHEHVQDASLPNYRMVWGDFARYTGLRGSNQRIQAAILAGEDLLVDSVPELAAIVDDKNSFGPGELEKGLATLLHPENRHVVIGVPRIEVTLPEDEDGGTISSPFARSVQAAREIHNAADGLTRAGLFELSSAAFGKWFLRPRAYFTHYAHEALNAAHALSHDFQQSYLVAGAAGRLGAFSEALCGPSCFEVTCGGPGGRLHERFVRVVRGEIIELYRVRLLPGGRATLERFENGSFGEARIFRPGPEPTMKSALAHITGFLNGTVSFGERELLSPTSAVTRNARWFPGDIQMLRTAFHYARELFPSAQFHVSQLFRRVFGDVAFLLLVILSGALWLGTDAPVASARLSLGLQIVSMVAIFGFDRYWEPMRLRLRRLRAGAGWRFLFQAPWLVIAQLLLGTASVAVSTLLGLANLIIHPIKVWQSWRQLAGGRALEWKASSVSATQDVRGWPVGEFRATYRAAVKVGWGAAAFGLWLVALGAPIGIFGLNGVGLFLASFLTVVLYAWCSGLPEASDGVPRYRLSRKELAGLMLSGLVGCAVSRRADPGRALSPAGVRGLGWRGDALSLAQRARRPGVSAPLPRPPAAARGTTSLARRGRRPRPSRCLPTCHNREHLPGFVLLDERRWRMPEPERRLYEEIERTRRRHAQVNPEPLLRSDGDQPTLDRPPTVPKPELSELRGDPGAALARVERARGPVAAGAPSPCPRATAPSFSSRDAGSPPLPSKRCRRWRRPSSPDAEPRRSPGGVRPR